MSALRRLLVINGGGYTLLDHIRTNNAYCTTPYKLKTTDRVQITMSCTTLDNKARGIFGYIKDSSYNGNMGVCFNVVINSFQGVSPKWCYFTKEKYQLGKKYTIFQQGKRFVFNGTTYTDPDSTELIDSEYFCRIGATQFTDTNQLADINIYQFSVNDEIWYPCKKGDVYGFYCLFRILSHFKGFN